ncbi:coenzyme F420-0:L-glutamate ligase [Hydrogenophaga sp.]|uniref:coenzyme F420-0:L-glutamate ligase n=1 Tax=Hydrogenophaga sp. TaxID=1904254 RepID=UPI00271F20A9|nr:coenzyme F420-0:L-glutamate ligase [Hydrogenophaga sp.]MDO9433943.1 coenzyme F420-0:L-glutamate ligase [Hydrogenophaga sp.]
MARELHLRGIALPHVRAGDDLAGLILAALSEYDNKLRAGDVLVIAQKVVSKSEGRQVRLADVRPCDRALELSKVTGKDARLVELVLSESSEVLRAKRDVLIVAHRLGFVMANAGVDQSNIEDGDASALLLPLDPDASCRRLREALQARTGVQVGIVMNDSHGRAWRNGAVGVCIGAAGLPALLDMRGLPDMFGRQLKVTEVGVADEIAAAASIVMGQADEGIPVVLCRGLTYPARDGSAAELVRPRQLDMFR